MHVRARGLGSKRGMGGAGPGRMKMSSSPGPSRILSQNVEKKRTQRGPNNTLSFYLFWEASKHFSTM